MQPPFLSLIASGGHTLLARVDDRGPGFEVLGQTLDDAAGEAFDKGARLLGLGYPGGPALERLAREGDPEAFAFPTAAKVQGLDFSFAGLKTALLYRVRELGEAETKRRRADLAASYQRAIVESLALKVERALAQTGLDRLAIGGGVAANGPLRERLADGLGAELDIPPRELCTDNAAMIASAARYVPRCRIRITSTRRVRDRRARCGRCDDDGRPVRPRGLLPVRRRPRDAAAGPGSASVRAAGAGHRDRRRAAARLSGADPGVVTIDGVEAFELFVDEAELERSGSS